MGNRTGKRLAQGIGACRHPLALAIAAALAASPVWAEDAASEEQLETIEVNAQQSEDVYGGDDFGYVGQRSLTATKTDTPVKETPRSISIVTREQMDDRASVSIADALQYTPSIQANFYGEDNKQDWFVIRGFKQANNGLYRDGTRVYSYGFYSWQLDPFAQERVEILRGPASVLYGQTPPGGVINVISKRPQDYSFGSVTAEYGSYDRKQLSVDVGGAPSENVAWRVVALGRENGTQVDDLEAERTLLAPSLKLGLGDNTELTLLASYQHDDSDPYLQFLPASGTISPNPNGKIDTDVAIGNLDYEQFERTQVSFGYQLDHAFSDATSFQQSARYQQVDVDLKQLFFWSYFPGSDSDVIRGLTDEDGKSDGINLDNRFIHKWTMNNMEHTLLAGVDYQSINIDGKSYLGSGYPIIGTEVVPGVGAPATLNPFNPQYANANDLIPVTACGVAGCTVVTERERTTIEAYQVGGYLQDQIKFDDSLVLTLGARFDRASSEIENKSTGSEQKVDNDVWTGNAGLAWLVNDNLTAYTSYSQFFQPILQLDQNGDSAKPQEGDQIEVGVKFQPEGIDGYLNAAAFKINQENLASGSGATFQQIGEVESDGIELEAVANITPSFSLLANATWMNPEIVSDNTAAEEGNRPVNIADTLYSAWAKYAFLEGPLSGFSIGSGVRYVSETYGDNTETLKVPSFTVWDATVSYRWKDFKFQVAAKNLEDKKYVATCDYYCWYGDRRNVIGSVTYAW
ncbi:MAG: TonB-dependent siderophore receptor [Pseudomonadota bacterium]|nr:TonB-dependent siderophore receptor [Pseudomonadota bacterium]